MSKTTKTTGTKAAVSSVVYEVRPGVFAKGKPGAKATTVLQRRDDGTFGGVRGVRPTIGEGARQATVTKAMAAELARLEGTK